MDNSLFTYMEQLEMMAFFSGYPLVYAIAVFVAGSKQVKINSGKRLISILPFAYAFVGTLYLALQLKNLYPFHSFENSWLNIQNPLLVTWALLSLLFWLPALAKTPSWSLIHSLVFFFFLLKDLAIVLFSTGNKSMLKNDMKIYTDSLLLNGCCVLAVLAFSYLFAYRRG
ncbi:hypothetical protein BH11BAC3_BH11BAC3_17580 [soil metagenome]